MLDLVDCISNFEDPLKNGRTMTEEGGGGKKKTQKNCKNFVFYQNFFLNLRKVF